ncbi:hypothetical protein I553_3601 [Mycobacterium xenopi 4042]|uniref:Uncharacterized protein n=1 Tax=Mycobacterium xenopi 4042 TaxID=1299334 RepID=X8DLU2_MYCXE|nr:hypothetical protein I553_3601 [Mycobacterium xenopi 4042]
MIAFSTASAPELNSAERLSPRPGQPVELLGDGDVVLVRGHHEAGVGELGDLRADGVHHPRGRVADRGDRDPRAEVDQPVAVDILDNPAAGARRVDRHDAADPAGHRGGSTLGQFQRGRARDFGEEVATLVDGGTSVSSRAVRVARWFEPIRGGSATTATRVAGYADGGTSGGRQALDVGSHHQPLSHASGCAATPSGRHTLAVGSHHWPLPQSSGCGRHPAADRHRRWGPPLARVALQRQRRVSRSAHVGLRVPPPAVRALRGTDGRRHGDRESHRRHCHYHDNR